LTDKEIARKVGVSQSTIQEWRDRRGLPQNYFYAKGDESREPPSEREVIERIKNTSHTSWREFFREEFNVSEGIWRKENWLDRHDFPKTNGGKYSIVRARMELLKEELMNIAEKYSASVAARKYNISEECVKSFLRDCRPDWKRNGWRKRPKKEEIEPFLPIEGKYFRLKNVSCDYMIVKEENNCILIEEKSSLSSYSFAEAVRQLMIAEKMVEDRFGLATQRKIIYCENPDADVQESKIRKTRKYLGIEVWDWEN